MLIIGSQAALYFGKLPEQYAYPRDTDIIGTFAEFKAFSAMIKETKGLAHCVPLGKNKFHIRDNVGWNYEFEIAWPGTTGESLMEYCGNGFTAALVAPLRVQLALKLSHRYLKDSPHFLKTMRYIQHYRQLGVVLDAWLEEWLVQRERATYTYGHPKLDVSKQEFFSGDGLAYVYDHDSIHETVALSLQPCQNKPLPAYQRYMAEGAAVLSSSEAFFALPFEFQLHGVYEETCVLALERSQIPFDFKPAARYSFEIALMKVCTSITSGWFRQFAYENYDKVLDLYRERGETEYIEQFNSNSKLLRAFKGD